MSGDFVSRRAFLAGLAGIAVVGCRKTEPPVAGGFVDDGGARGHRLRDGSRVQAPRRTVRVPVVIVGGGIAGLSAAWHLRRRGFSEFVLLEMEDQAGGNSRWGRNDFTAYPWAAHYVPVPGRQTVLARELFRDLGVLRDANGGGDAWDETALAFAPQERIFFRGRWHEGLLEPLLDAPADRAEFQRFQAIMAEHHAGGQFTIPSALGARPSPLDSLSMARWLDEHRFRSPVLRWYVDYACRDDYGALASDTSAWAGVHYFASRPPESEGHGPLTWAEGNGWIVRRLMERLHPFVSTGALVHRVERHGRGVRVLCGDTAYLADAVVFAAPSFVAPFVVEDAPPVDFAYSPWLTANLTLERWPGERAAEPAWDNVLYDSPSLGYVSATHQALAARVERTVWTYYRALAHAPPADSRALLRRRSWADWKELILSDLERAHPDIRACVSRVDILRMGHAMARPVPGFLSSPARRALADAAGPVFFANSDLGGLSLFEEAQHFGVVAAERALRHLGGSGPESFGAEAT